MATMSLPRAQATSLTHPDALWCFLVPVSVNFPLGETLWQLVCQQRDSAGHVEYYSIFKNS